MKYISMLCAALLLSACGGEANIPAPTKLRTDLLFGYYGSDATSVAETKNSTNLLFESMFYGEAQAIKNIREAKQQVILDVSAYTYSGNQGAVEARPDREQALREWLTKLQQEGLLQYIVAFYAIDEPDSNVKNPSDMLAVNATIRKVAAEFSEIKDVKIAVIFGGSERLTNIEDFDWVGFDHYGAGSKIFTNGEYKALTSRLKPSQKIILVPGAYDGQVVEPFFNVAQNDSRVVALLPFLWIEVHNVIGIKNKEIRKEYCLAGEKIKSPEKVPTGVC